MPKVYNFNPGPAMLPVEVMEKAQRTFTDYNNTGYGIIEASHRGSEFESVIKTAESNIRNLMSVPADYAVLFLQGGASTQFAMVPMNLLTPDASADYVLTGSWSEKAFNEAKLFGDIHIAGSSKANTYREIPEFNEWKLQQDARYLHITSNNTIFGTQFHKFPSDSNRVPLIADMSSDILARRIKVTDFGLIYAGAQKNIGPSGVTLVIVKKELVDKVSKGIPSMLNYMTHIKSASLYNTPPTFAIYMVYLVTEWLLSRGGLEVIEKVNRDKARLLYETIDKDDFYRCPAEPASRSLMNVCFRLKNEELEKKFIDEVTKEKMIGLKGHRSVGGIRASIYNAMPIEGVECLRNFMTQFKNRYG